MSISTHKIRLATGDDIASIYRLTMLEKWNIDLKFLHCMFDLDPTSWFVAESPTGEILGVRALFNINPNLASGGIYVVKKEARGRGLGRELYATADAETGPRSVVLETENMNLYSGKGFVYDYTILHKRLNVGNLVDILQSMKYDRATIPPYNEDMLPELLKYDVSVSKHSRPDFMKKFIVGACDALGVSFSETSGPGVGHVTGYGCLRTVNGLLRLCPLYADSANIALSLMLYLLQRVDRSKTIDMIIVEGHKLMEDLTSKIDHTNEVTLRKMQKGSWGNSDLARVYSLANECFCIV